MSVEVHKYNRLIIHTDEWGSFQQHIILTLTHAHKIRLRVNQLRGRGGGRVAGLLRDVFWWLWQDAPPKAGSGGPPQTWFWPQCRLLKTHACWEGPCCPHSEGFSTFPCFSTFPGNFSPGGTVGLAGSSPQVWLRTLEPPSSIASYFISWNMVIWCLYIFLIYWETISALHVSLYSIILKQCDLTLKHTDTLRSGLITKLTKQEPIPVLSTSAPEQSQFLPGCSVS